VGKKANRHIRKFILKNVPYYKGSNGRISWQELVELVEKNFPEERITFDRVRAIYRNSSERDLAKAMTGEYGNPSPQAILKEEPEKKTNVGTIKGKGDRLEATTTIDKNPANLSPKEIAQLFDVDLRIWEYNGYEAKTWNSTVRGSRGEPSKVVVNYSVKAKFIIRKDSVFMDKEVVKEIFEEAQDLYRRNYKNKKVIKPVGKEKGNTLVVGAYDVHLGKLAWWKETGENYDLKIASSRFLYVVKTIVDKAAAIGLDNIIFPVGNDFFQFDNDVPTTTKDTPVDTDVRWQKLFQKGVALLKTAIDYCAQFAKVDVIWVPGNHDFKASFYAFETLRGYYSLDKIVTISEEIRTRTYRLVGPNLLGFTHGDKEKARRLHELMSTDFPQLWGQSRYREWIVGHFHKGSLNEDMGVTVRVLGSITGTDAWHYQKGFVGSLRAAQGLIFNENRIGPSLILYEAIDITKEPQQK
jgi:hypothetical protein